MLVALNKIGDYEAYHHKRYRSPFGDLVHLLIEPRSAAKSRFGLSADGSSQTFGLCGLNSHQYNKKERTEYL